LVSIWGQARLVYEASSEEKPAVPTTSQAVPLNLMTAILTSYASKPVMQDSAVQVPANHLPDIRSIKAILPLKPVFVDLLERFKMVLNALVIWCAPGIALPVNRCRHEYRHLSEILPNTLFHRNTHARLTKLKAYPEKTPYVG